MAINEHGPLTRSQFSPGLRSFSSLRDFYFFRYNDVITIYPLRVSEIIKFGAKRREREAHRVAEEIIAKIIEKNHNNEIRTFPLENADYISKEKNTEKNH